MKRKKIERIKRQRYKRGNRLQKEGIIELAKLLFSEIINMIIKTAMIFAKVASALIKIIFGTLLKESAKRM